MPKVKEIFEAAGWTGGRLAAYFGVSKSHISHILHGRQRPKVLQIAMARLVNLTPEDLWGEWHWSRPQPPRRRRPARRRVRHETDGHGDGHRHRTGGRR
jgi:transcriptional regulator with XRE-family HTH domain